MSNNFGMPFFAEATDTIREIKYIPISTSPQFSNAPNYYIAQNSQRTFHDTITATIVPNMNQALPAPSVYQPNYQGNYFHPNVNRHPVILRPTFTHNAATTTDNIRRKTKLPCSCDHLNHCKQCIEFVQNEMKNKRRETVGSTMLDLYPTNKPHDALIESDGSVDKLQESKWDRLRELLKQGKISAEKDDIKFVVQLDTPNKASEPHSTWIAGSDKNFVSPKATDDPKYQIFVNELMSRDGDSTSQEGESRIEKSSSAEDLKTKTGQETYNSGSGTKNKITFNKVKPRKAEGSKKESGMYDESTKNKTKKDDTKRKEKSIGKSPKSNKDVSAPTEGKSGQIEDGTNSLSTPKDDKSNELRNISSDPKSGTKNDTGDSSNYSDGSTIKNNSNYKSDASPPKNTSSQKTKNTSNNKDNSSRPQNNTNNKSDSNRSKDSSANSQRAETSRPKPNTSSKKDDTSRPSTSASAKRNDKSSSSPNKISNHPKPPSSNTDEYKRVSFNSNDPAHPPEASNRANDAGYPTIVADHPADDTHEGSYHRRDDTGYPIFIGNHTREDNGHPADGSYHRRDDTGYPMFLGNHTRDDTGRPHDGSYNRRNDTGYPMFIDGKKDDTKHPSHESSYVTHDSVYVANPNKDASRNQRNDVTIEVGQDGELSFYTEPKRRQKKDDDEEDGEKDRTYKNEMFLFVNN